MHIIAPSFDAICTTIMLTHVHGKRIFVLLEGSLACSFLTACTEVEESDACPVKSAPKNDGKFRFSAALFQKISL
jgi:hypothetical protein